MECDIAERHFNLLNVTREEVSGSAATAKSRTSTKPARKGKDQPLAAKVHHYLVHSISSALPLPHFKTARAKLQRTLEQIGGDFRHMVTLGFTTTGGLILEVPEDPLLTKAVLNFLGQLDIMLWARKGHS